MKTAFNSLVFRILYVLENVYCIHGGQDVRRFIYIKYYGISMRAVLLRFRNACCSVDRNDHFVLKILVGFCE